MRTPRLTINPQIFLLLSVILLTLAAEPTPVVEDQLAPKYQVTVRALSVSSGPGINHPIIRDLHAGDIIQALDVSAPREVWLRIDEDQWCAMAYNGYHFLNKFE